MITGNTLKAAEQLAPTISQDLESSGIVITSPIVQDGPVSQVPIVPPAELHQVELVEQILTGTDVQVSAERQTSTTCEMFSAYKSRVNSNIDEEKNHPRLGRDHSDPVK